MGHLGQNKTIYLLQEDQLASFGIQTAALMCGGTTGPAVTTATEEYGGTSWTSGGAYLKLDNILQEQE